VLTSTSHFLGVTIKTSWTRGTNQLLVFVNPHVL